jgi:hypothetical protein
LMAACAGIAGNRLPRSVAVANRCLTNGLTSK